MKLLYSWLLDYFPSLKYETLEKFLSYNGCEINSVTYLNKEAASSNPIEKNREIIIHYTPPYNRRDLVSILGVVTGLRYLIDGKEGLDEFFDEKKINSKLREYKAIGGDNKLQIDDKLIQKTSLLALELFPEQFFSIGKDIRKRVDICDKQTDDEVLYIAKYVRLLTGQPIHLYKVSATKKETLLLKELDRVEATQKNPNSYDTSYTSPYNFPIVSIATVNGEKWNSMGVEELGRLSNDDSDDHARYILIALNIDDQIVFDLHQLMNRAPDSFALGFLQNPSELYLKNAIEQTLLIVEKLALKYNLLHLSLPSTEETHKNIDFTIKGLEKILGYCVEPKQLALYLKRIGCTVVDNSLCLVPKYRLDLDNIGDLAEEVDVLYEYFDLEKRPLRLDLENDHIDTRRSDTNLQMQYTLISIIRYLLFNDFVEIKSNPIVNSKSDRGRKGKIQISRSAFVMRDDVEISRSSLNSRSHEKFFEVGKYFDLANQRPEYLGLSCIFKQLPRERRWYTAQRKHSIYDALLVFSDVLKILKIEQPYILDNTTSDSDEDSIDTYGYLTISKDRVVKIQENNTYISLHIYLDILSKISYTPPNIHQSIAHLCEDITDFYSHSQYVETTKNRAGESYIDLNLVVNEDISYSNYLSKLRSILYDEFIEISSIQLIDVYREEEKRCCKLTFRIVFDLTSSKLSTLEASIKKLLKVNEFDLG
jgi:hypothetical protein